ncbi:hypothetical protein Q3H59_004490 [Pantoea sp. SORGH_AS 659]|nr:hypothetical protein [Pantoea sp. SORGH_AS_0659]
MSEEQSPHREDSNCLRERGHSRMSTSRYDMEGTATYKRRNNYLTVQPTY